MKKRTLLRTIRNRPLTDGEAEQDDAVRRQIRTEFPPLESKSGSSSLCDPLRAAIARSSKSPGSLAAEAHVSPVLLEQFLAGERDLRLATAEKLADLLGLKLVAG